MAAQDLPEACDVAVVGGGITGLSVAIHLAKAGADVALFEQHTLGWGASLRNGGQTLAGLKLSPQALVKKYGEARAVRLYRASLDAIDHLESFLRDEGIDCGFQRYGGLWAAYTPGHLEALRGTRELLEKTFSHETRLVEPAELREELGTGFYHGALLDPRSGGLNSGKYVLGLVQSASKHGVRLYENTEVVGIQRAGKGFEVATRGGRVDAAQVAIATNGYTPDFLGALRRRVIPIGSYIVATEPLDPDLARSLVPRGRMVFDTRKYLHYFRITDDHRMLFGGRASLTEIDPSAAAPVLRRSMVEIFPELGSAKIESAWSGYVGFTFDQMPHIGVRDGLYYAMGFCGHGVANGFYFGSRLALLMQDRLEDFPFVDLGFPTLPLYRKRPWFLPIVGAAYRLMDRTAR